jgi:hypothetical protein
MSSTTLFRINKDVLNAKKISCILTIHRHVNVSVQVLAKIVRNLKDGMNIHNAHADAPSFLFAIKVNTLIEGNAGAGVFQSGAAITKYLVFHVKTHADD